MKEYFTDLWSSITDPQAFIKKLDDYEIFRRSLKKPTTPKNNGNGKIVEKHDFSEKAKFTPERHEFKSNCRDKSETRERDHLIKEEVYCASIVSVLTI